MKEKYECVTNTGWALSMIANELAEMNRINRKKIKDAVQEEGQ